MLGQTIPFALSRRRPGAAARRTQLLDAVVVACAVIWAATMISAAVVIAVPGAGADVASLIAAPRPTLTPSVATALGIGAHNVPLALWPLLLPVVIGPAGRWARVGDACVVVALALNGAVVGVALGAYGVPLLRYLPQLPFEWAAWAVGSGSWLLARQRPTSRRERLALALVAVLLLAGAAAVETFLTPHR